MSPEEHYFENLLFAYSNGGRDAYRKCKDNDNNTRYFSEETKRAIETCAIYVIDVCNWEQETVKQFLEQ